MRCFPPSTRARPEQAGGGHQDTANGELETKTNTATNDEWIFGYDVLGNLLSVGLPNGDLIEYLVDGAGRRVAKKLNGVVTKQWIYRDALKPVAELDGSEALVAQFVYGSKSNAPDYVRRGGATYRVVSDHLGSPRYVVNVANASDVPFMANYSTLGSMTGSGLGWMPFGFAGGIYDPETQLVRFGARDYDAIVGRWTRKDPIRFGGRQANLYVYVASNPVNRTDPTGLTVYACQESNRDWAHYWWLWYGFSHAYLQTDTNTFGLYPGGPWPGDPAQIASDAFGDTSARVCQEIPNVDEDCVNHYAQLGSEWGAYSPWNNCGTFVADVLNACRPDSSVPWEGQEGTSGNATPPPFPPGGF